MAGGLVLGAVDFFSNAYKIEALGTDSGLSLGNAVPITQQLQTFLQYGSVVVNNGWENRDLVVTVRVKGTGAQMAAAEAALFAEVGKPNTLTYTPPASGSPATVFNVFYSSFEATPDDLMEQAATAGRRLYTIRLTCDPFAYSATLTTVAALAASGSTTTNVDTGSSTTGWTATVNGGAVSPAVVSGAVVATGGSAMSGVIPVVMTRVSLGATTSSTKYLIVDWRVGTGAWSDSFTATGDGTALTMVANGPSPTTGYTRTTFFVAASSLSTLVLTVATDSGASLVTRSVSIDNVAVSDVRPTMGSARQQLRSLAIAGSAPTIGSLSIQHSTTSLGHTLVYTCPDDGAGYVPACSSYRVSGPGLTADAGTVSGFHGIMNAGTTTYNILPSSLPAGEYLLMASIGGTTATGTVSYTFTPQVNSTTVGPVLSGSAVVTTTPAYTFFRLGMVHLPSVDLPPNPLAWMQLTLASTATQFLDEVYLFNLTTGDLTQVACGTGTAASGGPANRLWIDSPSLLNGALGRYLMGFAADRSDAYSAYPSAAAVGVHEFLPPSVKVFTVTNNPTAAADVSFTFYSAWPNSAGS